MKEENRVITFKNTLFYDKCPAIIVNCGNWFILTNAIYEIRIANIYQVISAILYMPCRDNNSYSFLDTEMRHAPASYSQAGAHILHTKRRLK